MKQNFNDYLFHCSGLGNIMGRIGLTDSQKEKLITLSDRKEDPKAKPLTANMEAELLDLKAKNDNPEFPETIKKYLTECYIDWEYGRKKDITNKYMIKGLEVEETSITMYDRIKNPLGKMTVKNNQFFANEYICGTPDIIEDKIRDIKSSWDLHSFFNAKETASKDYYWQLQGYMALTGLKAAELAYCLVDTPLALIHDEQRKLMWKMNVMSDNDPLYEAAKEEIERQLTFGDIPEEQRIHIVEYDRNQIHITQIYERVKLCRKYVNEKFYNIK